jgi:uncharacterized protein
MRSILTLLFFFSFASAHAIEVPRFVPNVVDLSSTLSPDEIGQLNVEIQAIREESHIFAAILLVPSIGGESIEAVAEAVFREWKLGQKGTDNGLLFFVAVGDRKMKIETGYGLEASIPDVRARQIIDEILKPNFRKQKFAEGLSEALKSANTLVRGGDPIQLRDSTDSWTGRFAAMALWFFFVMIVPAVLRASAVRRAANFEFKLRPSAEELRVSKVIFGKLSYLPFFFLLNPGIFFVLLAGTFAQWYIGVALLSFVYLFYGLTNLDYLSMRNPEARKRYFKKPPPRKKGAQNFDTYTDWSSSSDSSFSSSSSSSDFSSSSDGGSSGGGGASGDW